MFKNLLLSSSIFFSSYVYAEIKTKSITYDENGVKLEGYVAYDDALKNKKPGVLIFHDWMGLGEFSKAKAVELAKLGYLGFAADIYGQGVRPKDMDEAGKLATKYKNDRPLLRKRAEAALTALKKESNVDTNKIVAIGYCFGGTSSLELARDSAPLKGVVSFHGGLSNPVPSDASNIKGKVLVLHGAIDPLVPTTEVDAFEKEMNEAKVNWQLVKYSGAVHAFTNKMAGNDISKGFAYNEEADKRSWVAMKQFFKEIF